jgi:hypothetical protein
VLQRDFQLPVAFQLKLTAYVLLEPLPMQQIHDVVVIIGTTHARKLR